jgi:hypothetical protein
MVCAPDARWCSALGCTNAHRLIDDRLRVDHKRCAVVRLHQPAGLMHGLTSVLVEEGVSGSVPVKERPIGGQLFAKRPTAGFWRWTRPQGSTCLGTATSDQIDRMLGR